MSDVTKEDLREVERRVDNSILTFTDSVNALTKQLGAQTTQLALLVAKFDQNEKKYDKIEDHQISQGKQIGVLVGDVRELKTKQNGYSQILTNIVYPLVVLGIATWMVLKT